MHIMHRVAMKLRLWENLASMIRHFPPFHWRQGTSGMHVGGWVLESREARSLLVASGLVLRQIAMAVGCADLGRRQPSSD